MAAILHPAIAARPAPPAPSGPRAWIQSQLFGSPASAVGSVLIALLLLASVPGLLRWAVLDAVWRNDYEACRLASGACWGAITEKYRVILFGPYPLDQQWRALSATLALLTLLLLSGLRRFWTRWLVPAWLLLLAGVFTLMYGGLPGLPRVETEHWGGLPLTLLLAALSMAMAFPLALLVALGRSSQLAALRSICSLYVELVRGVPLVSVLFMASFMFPLLMPPGWQPDVLLRVLAGITLFAAAYMAEVIRGGLQALPRGQIEAAASLGLSYWQTQRNIVLPQALALVLPGIVNNFIATFKDTSLVTVVSLYELSGAMGLAFNSDANWRPFKLEGYLFIALVYFVFCFAMSRYSRWIETQLQRSQSR